MNIALDKPGSSAPHERVKRKKNRAIVQIFLWNERICNR